MKDYLKLLIIVNTALMLYWSVQIFFCKPSVTKVYRIGEGLNSILVFK